MLSKNHSWRILKIGCIATLISLFCVLNSEWAFAQVPPAPPQNVPSVGDVKALATTPYTRENIYTFINSPQKLQSLKDGIAEMKKRPSNDPTSWVYQANMHGTNTTPALDLWNTCQHGNFFFFSWHRMYVYYFERILRKASGDINFALPYWNYSEVDAQRVLPLPFRSPANSTNPLYDGKRNSTINQGNPLPSQDVSYQQAFQSKTFIGTTASGGFGGGSIPSPQHFSSLTGLLESQPHNIIHVYLGGQRGDMTDPNTAALDPIFWLHHANIDRLWESWISLDQGRADSSDKIFLDTPFSFFDENKTKVTLTGRQILDTVKNLNYRYDQLSGQLKSQASNPQLIELTDSRFTQTLGLPSTTQTRSLTSESVTPEATPLIVNIEGIEYDPSNTVPYEIYLNLPSGVQPTPDSPYYVGKLALFAHPQGGTISFDITDIVSKLKSLNLFKDEQLSVTVLPPKPGQYITSDQLEKQSLARSERGLSLEETSPQLQDISNPTIRFKKISVLKGE